MVTTPINVAMAAELSSKVHPATDCSGFEDVTREACGNFEVIDTCTYAARSLGGSENLGSMGCDCYEDTSHGINRACGEDSDCINRVTKIECVDDDRLCGSDCQNQRFRRREFADVSVISTEKKGYGLRANAFLPADTFIYEYIGEVISEPAFRRRTSQYNDEGIKHFYFMSLSKGVFVDATKRGNLGRFCNHSCSPNCYVDKWVVGEKLRMGIFTERDVQRGEELVFNYNVDRYGADPQRCYCGEPDCVGFIGGRTQTERATKLSNLTIQALGLDEAEAWDVTVAKKIRKKKPMSDDEEYCEANQARQLNREGAQKLVAAMLLERERWVVVQMLDRLQSCQEEAVLSRVAVVHGYNAMNAHLLEWQGDAAILLQILDILFHLPRLSKNKIEDAHIEPTVQALASHADDSVRDRASSLLSEWAALQRAYRIPRKRKEDVHLAISTPSTPSATDGTGQDENGQADISTLQHRTRFPSNSAGAPPPPTSQPNRVPVAPRNWTQAPKPPAWNVPRRFDIRIKGSLPSGWTSALHDGQQYYFSVSGKTTWQRPTAPDDVPPPPPAPIKSTEQRLQDIVDGITKAGLAATVQPVQQGPRNGELEAPKEVKREEKWRKLPLEKQQKLYESSISTLVREVMKKYYKKLSKEDLKKCGQEIGKHIVESDYKHSRVKDPSKIEEKQRARIVKYATEYFDKAVSRRRKMRNDKERAKSRGSIGDEPDQVNDSIANIDELKLAESLPTIGVADSMNGDTSLVPVEEPRGAKRKTLHDGTTEREEL